MTTRIARRLIVGVLLAASIGAAVAVHVVSTNGLHDKRIDRIQSARHPSTDAVQRRAYFLEDLADMVGVHDDAAAAEFSRYAHVRGRNEAAVVSVQWVRRSPGGALIPPADGDPNPGRTPILIAPAARGNDALADSAREQAAGEAVRTASLQRETAVSAPVTLADGDRGFYLAVPVQAHRYSGSLSKAESQSAIVGLIDAQTLAAQALGRGSPAFQLRDRITPLASIGSGLDNASRAAVPVAGRKWTVAVAGGSLSGFETALPWIVLVFGFAVTIAVAALLGMTARRRDEALQLAAQRLADLEVSLQRVELANRELEVAHADADRDVEQRRAGLGGNAEFVDEHLVAATDALLDAAGITEVTPVLELGAGPGGAGLRAAQRVGAGGSIVLSDDAPEMVAVAARRAVGCPQVSTAVFDKSEIVAGRPRATASRVSAGCSRRR